MNPREPFSRLLDIFDGPLQHAAAKHGFVFDPGLHQVTRAIRLKDDPLKRGVFLDLKDHWMQSDPIDPAVVLNYGAWSNSRVLIKNFYDGRLSELVQRITPTLEQAIAELMKVSEKIIDQDGKSLEDLSTGKGKP